MRSKTQFRNMKSGESWRVAIGALVLGIGFIWTAATVLAQEKPTYAVLHRFTGVDGANPQAALITDERGNLYGTAFNGGDLSACGGAGCGVVFKLDRHRKETVLYTFEAGTDGAGPAADLFRDRTGNLYSTTHGGGDVTGCFFEGGVPWTGCGVVFKLDRNGTETTLYEFTGGTDGGGPSSGVVQDQAGNLYGTTVFGGDISDCSFYEMPGCGVVYKVDPTSGKESALHSFTGGVDGLASYGDLLLDRWGNLFGATDNGGDTASTFCGQTVANFTGLPGCGTIFEIHRDGKFDVLHTFEGADGGPYGDGWLARDRRGNIYGVTGNGGDLSECGYGCGVVFRLRPNGEEKVLYSFTGGADGATPLASVVRDADGNLYGTAAYGGDLTDSPCAAVGGCGVVFKVDPAGHETVLHTFKGGPDGASPSANLLLGEDGNLYGTTQFGGATDGGNSCSVPGASLPGCGVVFKITLRGSDR
jgi:uncharacterized repeat protein (TIGR03803 family)